MSSPPTAIDAPPGLAPLPHRGPGFRWRILLWGSVTGLLLALGLEIGCMIGSRNFHPVIRGHVYRCAQMTSGKLDTVLKAHGIRTVVNLRGYCAPFPWYLDECRTTQGGEVSHEDITLSAGRLPSVHEIRRLVDVLDRTEYPVLLHCRHGADRTGLVSAVVLLLQTEAGLAQARYQLGLRYGHIRLGRTRHLDRFFDLYEEWLHDQGREHSRAAFRRWITQDYCPGECRCQLTPLEVPASIEAGRPAAIRLRVRNTSVKPWYMHPGTNAGIHAVYAIGDGKNQCLSLDRAGLLEAVVAPGEHIDLTLALPVLNDPGVYSMLIDLADEQHCWFYQAGSDPLQLTFQVQESSSPRNLRGAGRR